MLLGLLGEARSGKNTVARGLLKSRDGHELSFAYPIKELLCKQILGMSDEQVYGSLKEVVDPRFKKTPREIMQYLGTDVFRTLKNGVWTDFFVRNLRELQDKNPTGLFVVTDVRFKNEVELIKDLGGCVIKLVREDGPGASGGIKGHASEEELKTIPDSAFDAIIGAKGGDVEGLIKSAGNVLDLLNLNKSLCCGSK